MSTLDPIDAKAKAYSDARERLAESVAALNDAIAAAKREHLPGIKQNLKRAFQAEANLRALVADHPELFVKPRTVVLHGVQVGYAKGKGVIVFDNPEKVVALIKRKLPDQAAVLIATKETPVKKALAQLAVADLKAIGCSVQEAGDQVVVRAVDSAVDKLVDAMLQALQIDAEQAMADG